MSYSTLADVLVVFHALYAIFVVAGLVLILFGVARGWQWVRNFWFRVVHFLMIGVVVAEVALGVTCPITDWEQQALEKAGRESYEGSFIAYWANRLLYYGLPQWIFSVLQCLFGAAVLATLILAPPRWPWQQKHTAGTA